MCRKAFVKKATKKNNISPYPILHEPNLFFLGPFLGKHEFNHISLSKLKNKKEMNTRIFQIHWHLSLIKNCYITPLITGN